jgi:hypothetical protein
MIVILIRSATGTTIESFGHVAFIFLWLALALEDGGTSSALEPGQVHAT